MKKLKHTLPHPISPALNSNIDKSIKDWRSWPMGGGETSKVEVRASVWICEGSLAGQSLTSFITAAGS